MDSHKQISQSRAKNNGLNSHTVIPNICLIIGPWWVLDWCQYVCNHRVKTVKLEERHHPVHTLTDHNSNKKQGLDSMTCLDTMPGSSAPSPTNSNTAIMHRTMCHRKATPRISSMYTSSPSSGFASDNNDGASSTLTAWLLLSLSPSNRRISANRISLNSQIEAHEFEQFIGSI